MFPSWFWYSSPLIGLFAAIGAAIELSSGHLVRAFLELLVGALLITFRDDIARFADSRLSRMLVALVLALAALFVLANLGSLL